ncbi:MAG: hypothetical protein D3903_05740 [Candidatus Electrothrix sp. GM3_4]|nr:hypothetical protein [Candidatus Electrothrix sp. GM3_4]
MKTVKLKFLVQVTFLLLLSVCTAQATTTLTVIGRHPVYKPPLKSVDDLRGMMQTQQAAIRQGLQAAGANELYAPLMQQFSQADIQHVEYQAGETFHWMLFRTNGVGRVKAAQDLRWGGKATLSAYEFFIDSGDKRYLFAVPLFCGNLALKEVLERIVTVPGPEREVLERIVNVPGPERIVEVPKYVERIVEIPGPERIVRVPGPERIVQGPERIVEKLVEAAPQCCPPCIYPIRLVADMGYLRLSDPADFGFGRIGVEYAFNQRLSFLGMIGGAAKADGSDGDDAWLVDFMLQYNLFFLQVGDAWNPVFLGFGLGGWMSNGDDDIDSEDSDIDIIAQVGTQIYGHPDSFNTSVFFEARSGIDETDKLSEYGRFGAGLRFRF